MARYKNKIKQMPEKYMMYRVGKEYGDLKLAKDMSIDDLYEAFQALVLFNEEENA